LDSNNVQISVPPGKYKIYEQKIGSRQIFEYNGDGEGYDVQSGDNVIVPMYVNTIMKDIFADAPWRINPGNEIPILFEIKDSDENDYPLSEIRVYDNSNGNLIKTFDSEFELDGDSCDFGLTTGFKNIHQDLWYKIGYVNPDDFTKDKNGDISIKVSFDAKTWCDPLDFDIHDFLTVTVADDTLPNIDNWYYGDTHFHSQYTDNFVESGGPIEATKIISNVMGIDWVTITDHSFDLDDEALDWADFGGATDKWSSLNNEASSYSDDTFKAIVGEEISVNNSYRNDDYPNGKYIHLLAYDIDDFIEGEGADSKWPMSESGQKFSLNSVVESINNQGGFSYAAHPVSQPPHDTAGYVNNYYLSKGDWLEEDYNVEGLTGLEIWNTKTGDWESNINEGIIQWKNLLKLGYHIYIEGGSDAHGDYNKGRTITTTAFFELSDVEENENAFAKVRTLVYTEDFSNSGILNALRNGNSIMTDGPVVVFDITNENDKKAIIGNKIIGDQLTLNVEWKSTSEFGDINGIYFFRGTIGEEEIELSDLNFAPNNKYGKKSFNINSYLLLEKDSYIRVVATTQMRINKNGLVESFRAYTNPIFINKKSPEGPLDLIFVIDTTGSMGDDIAAVKSSASEIVEALDSKTNDYRVSVVDYRDYPQSPYGQPDLDYVYKLDLPFSNDKNTIINSINSLNLGSGMDWRESVYSALVKTMIDSNKDLSNSDNYGWRKGVNKAIIIMGDAPPHDPEPWVGGYTLEDVAYWSENIDPVIVYSVAIGSDSTTYSAFSEISERTGGKVYTSPTASDIVDTIIEVIGDIGETPNIGVSVNVNPTINEANPSQSVTYSIDVTNTGTIADTYDVSIDTQNFAGTYRGYPTAIQEAWTYLDQTSVEIEPGVTETVSITISVPNNWAGMGDVIYPFNVIAKSETDELISNTSSAELKVVANQRSMVEYSRLETIWLSELIQSSSVDDGIKNSLLAKLTTATLKLDQAMLKIEGGTYEQANNMLGASQNIINAFINQVEAQYDKKIIQPDAEMLMGEANTILQDIESAQNT